MSEFNQVQIWTVEQDCDGQRVDNYLFSRLKGVPKSRIYRLLRKGEIRVDKKRVKPETRLSGGSQVRIPPIRISEKQVIDGGKIESLGRAAKLEQQILFEDKSTLILNKPSGIAVHGGSGLNYGVIEALRKLRPDERFLELVHRLDKHTSGVLLLAKKRSALRFYQEQLRRKSMQKVYLAIGCGRWQGASKVTVETGLRKHLHPSGERMVYVDAEGKQSITQIEKVSSNTPYFLLRAKPLTGRTHQIRVHALHLGVPLFGDEKYHPDYASHKLNDKQCKQFFLHAEKLTFELYGEIGKFTAHAPLPDKFTDTLRLLGLRYGQ